MSCDRFVVRFEKSALVGRLDDVAWRQRLSCDRERTAILDPVEMNRPAFVGAEQILDRRVRRVTGIGTR